MTKAKNAERSPSRRIGAVKFFGGQIGRFLLSFDRRLGLPEPVTVPTCDYRRLAHRFSPPSTLHNRVRYLTLNMGMMIWHIPRGISICEFFGFATSYHAWDRMRYGRGFGYSAFANCRSVALSRNMTPSHPITAPCYLLAISPATSDSVARRCRASRSTRRRGAWSSSSSSSTLAPRRPRCCRRRSAAAASGVIAG